MSKRPATNQLRPNSDAPDPSRKTLLMSGYFCQSCQRDVLEFVNSKEHSKQCIANDILVSLKPHLSVDQESPSQSEREQAVSKILGNDANIVDILPEPEAERCGFCGNYFNRSTLVEHHLNCPDRVSLSYNIDKLSITGMSKTVVAHVEYVAHIFPFSSAICLFQVC